MDISDPLRHHQALSGPRARSFSYAGGSSFMERVSEGVASVMGTVGFLIVSSGVIIAWVLSNHVIHFLAKYQGVLLKKNTDLTEQIHELAEQLNKLTEEVHRATCPASPLGPASTH